MRAFTVWGVTGGVVGGLLVAVPAFVLTYDSLALSLQHQGIFPAEAAVASAALAAAAGAFGAFTGTVAGLVLSLLVVKRKPPA
jgi:hypothetical protein